MNEWEWRALEDRPPIESLPHDGGELRSGTKVRLRPHPGGDAMDLFLAGKVAMIESIEQDYEGTFHVAVVLDDDPGRDLGLMRQPGHRFFYTPAEVELCEQADQPDPSGVSPLPAEAAVAAASPILIAGIGNIFLGDDGFGVAVAQRLLAGGLPPGVKVTDFGIRSLDLAYALIDAPGWTILIDACPRGETPGTLFVIEPDLESAVAADGSVPLDAHAMNPMVVIRMASSLGGAPKRILVLGCEPATFGPEEGELGLSGPVDAAVGEAAAMALELVQKIRRGEAAGAA